MKWGANVQIKEVGPRDGLQNERAFLATEDKIHWINQMSHSGLKYIEITSFVNSKWIPALSDSLEVAKGIKRVSGVTYSALVPNLRGLDKAIEANVDEVSVFMSASETHNRKNINKSIGDTFPVLNEVVQEAQMAGKTVRGYISTVFGCPYEGQVSINHVIRVADQLLEMGVAELSLGDTIGAASPKQVQIVLENLLKRYPVEKFALHFHDTRGAALANVLMALDMGITIFDSSTGGLGGCPYSPGASGNVATEDLLYMLHHMGIQSGISLEKQLTAALFIREKIGRNLPSRNLQVSAGNPSPKGMKEENHFRKETVEFKTQDKGVALITLNRPHAANSLSIKMLEELKAVLESCKFDPAIRCVIITGAGEKVFCAGADLKERAAMDAHNVKKTVSLIRSVINHIESLPQPVIAAVNGSAFGGGTELALACDIRVAAETAKFALTETSLGIIPGAGGTQRLPRLVGKGRAKELIFTGRSIDAGEAKEIGLVEYVTTPESLLDKAVEVALSIVRNAPIALAQAKFAIDKGYDVDLQTGLSIEQKGYEITIPTKDRLEGLQAFKEKRAPVYKGE